MPVTRSVSGTPSCFAAQTMEAPSALMRGHALTISLSCGSSSMRLTFEALITTCCVGTPSSTILSTSARVSSMDSALT